MAKKITFGNFKGGTGKTTNSTMVAYHLAKKGYKTLLVDLDPQANATAMLLLTVQNQKDIVVNFETTLMTAIAENNLSKIVTEINDKLFLLPSFADFTSYPLYLEKKFPDSIRERGLYFKKLLSEFDKEYDYIIFDIPPTLSLFTDSAMLASDYVVIVLQTQERSFVGAEAFIQYMQELLDNYEVNFDILGILPVLLKNNAIVDKSVLKNAKETFGESNLFENIVKNMERLKRYDMTGIIDPEVNKKFDVHDMNVHRLYDKVTAELIERGNNHE